MSSWALFLLATSIMGVKPLKMRLRAAKELLKRYSCSKKVEVPSDVIIDSVAVIISLHASANQKKAAKMILDYALGEKIADGIVEDNAVVAGRNDKLVRKWRKMVIERDGKCMECGSVVELHAHHISHWADDPINRVNIENGITLCKECHAKEHPEIDNLIRGGGSA